MALRTLHSLSQNNINLCWFRIGSLYLDSELDISVFSILLILGLHIRCRPKTLILALRLSWDEVRSWSFSDIRIDSSCYSNAESQKKRIQ